MENHFNLAEIPFEQLNKEDKLQFIDEIDDFPGRRFHIISISSFNKKELKQKLKGVEQANITVRNFPLSTDQLRKRLKIKDGGDVYIFATTVWNDQHALIICKKMM